MKNYVSNIIGQINMQLDRGVDFDYVEASILLNSKHALHVLCNVDGNPEEGLGEKYYTVRVRDYFKDTNGVYFGDSVRVECCGLDYGLLETASANDKQEELEECIYEVLKIYFNS